MPRAKSNARPTAFSSARGIVSHAPQFPVSAGARETVTRVLKWHFTARMRFFTATIGDALTKHY